jgi:hypothetical protein
MAMMAITTKSSIIVKPVGRRREERGRLYMGAPEMKKMNANGKAPGPTGKVLQ